MQTENKAGAASSRSAMPEDGTSRGFTVPGVPPRPPDAFTQAMTPLMYSQWLTTMALRSFKATHALLLAYLETALAGDLAGELDGEQATVVAVYADNGEIRSLTVNAQNEKLKDILQTGVPWRTIPSPGSLSLPYRECSFTSPWTRARSISACHPPPDRRLKKERRALRTRLLACVQIFLNLR